MLAAAFRLFSRFGFDEGVAGHITARDPEQTVASLAQPFDALYFIDTMKPATLI
jgi:ribulose-5-phosphate 4-epimerase/fuculose-1-phosphate aldolase